MTCRQATSLMGSYLSKDLDLDAIWLFERHLALCPDCAAFFATYKKTIQALPALPRENISFEGVTRIRRLLSQKIGPTAPCC